MRSFVCANFMRILCIMNFRICLWKFLGLSSGFNVAGAVRFAKERGRGQTLVTLLCDSGHKYQSTLYNSEWLATKHLDPGPPLESVFG